MATMNFNRMRDVDVVIDKANDNFIQKQWVSAGDKDGRTLTVMVTDAGVVGEVPGVTLSLLWRNLANGISDEHAFVVKDKATSKFIIEFPDNMLTQGKVIAQIRIWFDGKVVATKPFEIEVGGIAGQMKGVVAQQEFGLLTDVLADSNKFRTDINTLGNQKVDKGGNEQITMPMLSQSVKEAMTGGSVAVVGVNAVNTSNVVDKAITRQKTNYYSVANNIYNSSNFISGGYYKAENGEYVTDPAWGWISILNFEYISYKLFKLLESTNRHVTYWSNGTYLYGESVNIFTPVASTDEIRISIRVVEKEQIEIVPYADSRLKYKDNDLYVDNDNISSNVIFGKENMDFLKKTQSKINVFSSNGMRDNGAYDYLTGDWTRNIIYFTSNKYAVSVGDVIRTDSKGSETLYTNFWDEKGDWLSGVRQRTNVLVPDGAYFATSTFNKDKGDTINNVMITVNMPMPEEYTPYEQYVFDKSIFVGNQDKSSADILKGKTLIATGDSIVSAEDRYGENIKGYIEIVADYLGMNLKNYAISGSTIAVQPDNPSERTPLATRYQNMSDDGDVIYVQCGTNDWNYQWTDIGTMSDRTVNTLYGALHVLLNGLMTKYPSKQIIYGLPIKRRAIFEDTNDVGMTLWQYCEIIKEVCDYYSIQVLDLYHESMMNPHIPDQRTAYLPDATHPNRVGHEILALPVISRFKGIVLRWQQ